MTLIARTLKDRSTARVLRGILVMELRAMVSSIFNAEFILFSQNVSNQTFNILAKFIEGTIDTIDPHSLNTCQNGHFLYLKPRSFLWIVKPAFWATSSEQRKSFTYYWLIQYKRFSRCLILRPDDLVPRYLYTVSSSIQN